MKILKNLKKKIPKKYFKILTSLGFILAGILTMKMVGCQDLRFESIPGEPDFNTFSCEEEASSVEGVSCIGPGEYDSPDGDYGDDGDGDYGDGDGGYGDGDDDDDSYRRRARGEEGIYDDDESSSFASRPKTRLKIKLGRINVLFVVDTSASMREELSSIANQFDSFLGDIRKADYQIAIITADAERDRGDFLGFSNGDLWLSNPDKDSSTHRRNVRDFQEVIQQSVGDLEDERGIYALNMALDNTAHAEFFRPHSLLMVIIISDEDERSYGGQLPKGYFGSVPPLEPYDEPETFFRKVSHQNPYSIVTVHSIIVPPKDSKCREQAGGVEGHVYAQASKPSNKIRRQHGNIRQGHIGSICSTDYSSQLGPIADSLLKPPPISLPCFPIEETVSVRVGNKYVKFDIEGRQLVINKKVSFGSNARVRFSCQD